MARADLAIELAKFPCLLTHSGSQCVPVTKKLKLFANPSYPTVVGRLLDGPEDEVTALVRRRVYDALSCSIRHCSGAYDGLDHTADIIFRGMRDKDRNVRLGAG
jgi:serine/threonine-protein kinase ATR